ncbi:hemolytic protein HlpA-like protein [Hydrocoleum sp. CS-953]|uniref:hemolytic protein HlpA-like protein n=1 Tax=Hydrocoleum sp. CS-953 TaxID=1671698 RepID=UPI000B9C36C3|nr:hemolytic protein HlpA-like protein [Hydrocoleum sp. CS-953]OZH55096.1 hemolytic protein HlpA-like protein [Hydrocoleum sp. CS-953]
MNDWQVKIPVVLLIFNRPDTTEKVFEVIRKAKPPKLFVVADGPRPDRPEDIKKCAAARAIVDQVDWECQVLTNYSEMNLSCQHRVSSGLNWVFENVEEAIILEDDCIPHITFFRFCEELLERYRNDERIMVISGQNVQFGRQRFDYSYYFSRYNHYWGWATWKRAWKYFDFDMKLWSKVREAGLLQDILRDPHVVKVWTHVFDSVYNGRVNSWGQRWTFACWINSGLTILSNVNLVSNVGAGRYDATHTKKATPYSNIPAEEMTFPLKHPELMIRDAIADDFSQDLCFDYLPTVWKRVKLKLKKIFKNIKR